MTARQQAEQLSNAAATTQNLLLLAQLQLDTGDPKALALNVRQLAQRQDLNSDQALRLAMLVRQEDPHLSRSLWRRAVVNALPDEAVGTALSLGYHLGLDREMRPVLVRMHDLAERGKGGIERKTLPDLIEHVRPRFIRTARHGRRHHTRRRRQRRNPPALRSPIDAEIALPLQPGRVPDGLAQLVSQRPRELFQWTPGKPHACPPVQHDRHWRDAAPGNLPCPS